MGTPQSFPKTFSELWLDLHSGIFDKQRLSYDGGKLDWFLGVILCRRREA